MINEQRKAKIFAIKAFLCKYKTHFGIWTILVILAYVLKFLRGKANNYFIYKYVFWHTTEGTPLYTEYPTEYFDVNHYGPFFSLVIAPFAVLPDWLGAFLWLFALTAFLFVAIKLLPIPKKHHIFIYSFCVIELISALFMYQFNIAIAAIIILAYVLINKEKDIWSTFFIVLGMFVKLYGIVGLCFFFFSKHKIKFIFSFIGWSLLFFVAPMIISSPNYVIGEYAAWFHELGDKNSLNFFAVYQNISLLGMIRKISGSMAYSDLCIIIPGMILFLLPYLRIKQYSYQGFRLSLLASVLLFIVLFSTGTESSSYIIAFVGAAIWYIAVPWKRGKLDLFLLIFVFIFSGLCTSDLVPKSIVVNYVRPYALKALPCVILWLKIVYEMCTYNYSKEEIKEYV